jgi:hypothetical protein
MHACLYKLVNWAGFFAVVKKNKSATISFVFCSSSKSLCAEAVNASPQLNFDLRCSCFDNNVGSKRKQACNSPFDPGC